jgi:hypothetical protein
MAIYKFFQLIYTIRKNWIHLLKRRCKHRVDPFQIPFHIAKMAPLQFFPERGLLCLQMEFFHVLVGAVQPCLSLVVREPCEL